jgi:hypothetical protein
MEYLASYVNPKSLTFWAGAAAIGIGILQIAGVQNDQIPVISNIIVAFAGGGATDPASLIMLGCGLLGIRRKLEEIGK